MRLGVISDTHDNIWKLGEALPELRTMDALLHCGDLCSPFMIKRLGEGLEGLPIHIVWGNNDGDTHLLTKVSFSYEDIHLHGLTARLDFEGYSVAVNHYPDLARDMANSGSYNLVCYGHDHTAHEERVGDTLLLNPGEIMGMNGRSSFAWVETETRAATFIDL
jgi:putative phosphoesterase